MTDEILAFLIAIAILLALFVWIPTLEICSEGCQKLLRGGRQRKATSAAQHTAAARSAATPQTQAAAQRLVETESIKAA